MTVGTYYSDLYDAIPELTTATLDALGHLTLASESLEDVRHSVLKTLQAKTPEQLPVVVKFLLHNTPQTMAYQVSILFYLRHKILILRVCWCVARDLL